MQKAADVMFIDGGHAGMKYVLVALTFLSFQVSADPELKGSPGELRNLLHPSDRIVAISANAEKTAYSDKAILSVAITTEEETLSAAIRENDTIRARITEQLEEAGIASSNIKSSKFSMSPQYGWFGKSPSSFKIVNRMAISIFETKDLETVARVADQGEESRLINTSFEHTEKDGFQAEVKKLALEKILKQKTLYEDALGVELEPVAFHEGAVQQAPTRGAQMIEEVIVTASQRGGSYSPSSVVETEPPLPSFDEIRYKAEITVEFKVMGTADASP